MLQVTLLMGVLVSGATEHFVSLEFKTVATCNAAKSVLQAKYPSSTFNCVNGAVHRSQ